MHIGTTVSVLGADLALLTLGLARLGGADPLTIYPAAHLVASRVILPLAFLSLGTGLLLALFTPLGLFKHAWITIKLGIAVLLTVAVVFVLVPRIGATALDVARPSPPAPGGLARVPLVVAPVIASTLLCVALALAVLKPEWPRKRERGGVERTKV